jgi:predicted nuclease of predicted toxin-antitoxin system
MIRLLTDENVDNNILRGLGRRLPQLDFVSVRDVGLAGSPDLVLLKWAAKEQRIILTHDVRTLVRDANQLVAQGEPMAGVIFVPIQLEIGRAINNLEIVIECSTESEMRDSVKYLPL